MMCPKRKDDIHEKVYSVNYDTADWLLIVCL